MHKSPCCSFNVKYNEIVWSKGLYWLSLRSGRSRNLLSTINKSVTYTVAPQISSHFKWRATSYRKEVKVNCHRKKKKTWASPVISLSFPKTLCHRSQVRTVLTELYFSGIQSCLIWTGSNIHPSHSWSEIHYQTPTAAKEPLGLSVLAAAELQDRFVSLNLDTIRAREGK